MRPKMMSQSFRESMLICKDLTQRTTDFQKAIVNSQLHNHPRKPRASTGTGREGRDLMI